MFGCNHLTITYNPTTQSIFSVLEPTLLTLFVLELLVSLGSGISAVTVQAPHPD